MNQKKIAVILSGCGFQDGAEIHESTCVLLALDLAGVQVECFAPNKQQGVVVNHLTGSNDSEAGRNILTESARIARGNVKAMTAFKVDDFDALVMPGGFGAAMNLSNFGSAGENCEVDMGVDQAIQAFAKAKKPIGAICIAPATLAKSLQSAGVHATLTIGSDEVVAEKITAMGHKHEVCAATDCVIDQENKVVTTPAYMTAQGIGEVWGGGEKLIKTVVEMA